MYRIRTGFTGLTGAPYLSTMYFSEGGGTAQQAADAVATFWGAVDNHMYSGLVWAVESTVALVDSATGETTGIAGVTGGTGAGSSGSDPLPFATQLLVRWRTGTFYGGREIRGRTFVPGINEGQSNGSPSSTVIAAANVAGANLISDANSLLIVWSKTNGLEEVVDVADTWTQFAVLRSRRD